MTLRSEIVEALEENELEELASEADMYKFNKSVKMYYAESEDFDGLIELGEIRLENMEGIEKLLELDAICIWPEFYYFD